MTPYRNSDFNLEDFLAFLVYIAVLWIAAPLAILNLVRP